MPLLGTLLKNRRAGQANLAWNLPALAGPEVLGLRSDAFEHDGDMPAAHAGKRAGGQNVSPPLAWTSAPEGTAQLLLVIEDVDAPAKSPFVHCVALLEPDLDALPAGALNADTSAPGVRVLRSSMGRGYLGPEPIKGHGPHRYVLSAVRLARPDLRHRRRNGTGRGQAEGCHRRRARSRPGPRPPGRAVRPLTCPPASGRAQRARTAGVNGVRPGR